MIVKRGRGFLLSGKNYSYAMCVTETGFLQHLHYGGLIDEGDLEDLIRRLDCVVPHEGLNMDAAFQEMPSEYGFFAHGDYRDPTAIFCRSDGASMSRLRYVSHRIQKGAEELVQLPHARTVDETLSITLKDDFSNAEVTLVYSVCDCSDVLVRNAVIRNAGEDSIDLKKAFSFRLELPNGEYEAMRLWGTWGQERIPNVEPIGHGITRLQSLYGRSSHETNPFLGILKKNCEEERGECYGVQLVYSGSFAITAEWCKTGSLCVQGGVSDVNFGWELKGGEKFVTPQVLLCYSQEGTGGMSRAFADFLRERIVDPKYAFASRPVVVNNWEATEFDFDNEKLYRIIDSAKGLGIDTFVLDDGWFGKRDDDKSGLGDWVVNEKKLSGGLDSVIARCKQNGLKFGLWFEPEMICEDSDLYRAHPDYALKKEGVDPARQRNQLMLDFTRKEVVDYIFESVSKILKNHEISYVKWDMNRSMSEVYSASLPAHRQGEVMHRYTLGVYDLARRLKEAFPDVFFEGCSSGGGRFDSGMLYYFPQIWTSDVTDSYERTKIQWGTSLCYPLSSMSCHVSACPNRQLERTTPFSTRGAIASLGATGYELDLSKLSFEEKALVKTQISEYKKIESLILGGDLYRLVSPFEGEYFCEMVVSKDKTSAYLVGMQIFANPCWSYRKSVFLRGLDDRKTYEIKELKTTASGRALKNAGLFLPKLKDFCSWTWHIKEVKK